MVATVYLLVGRNGTAGKDEGGACVEFSGESLAREGVNDIEAGRDSAVLRLIVNHADGVGVR